MSYATLTTPGTDITFQGSGASAGVAGYYITNVDGIGMAPIRAPIDDKPMTDGGIVHNFYLGARHLTIEGFILPFANNPTDLATLDDAKEVLAVSLTTILRADGSYSWQAGGQTATLTVRCDVPVTFQNSGRKRTFVFGLVAANPAIAWST